jgi:hypothetical protein
MVRFLTGAILSGMALAQVMSGQARFVPEASPVSSTKAPANSADIPPAPMGNSTVFGGEIRDVDPVRDQLTLRVLGEHPMKILFDERTQVYRDGARVPLRDLHSSEHASIQTTLDGTKLFAVSIHMLSRSEDGEYEGRVLRFDPGTRELFVAAGQSRETLKLLVDGNTSFVRKGQSTFSATQSGSSDLESGTLVSVQFRPGRKDQAVASKVEILAVPGSTFVFSGSLSSLDLHAGLLVLIDPRDSRSYPVSFNPAGIPEVQRLHLGETVRVVTRYDGTNYVASDITVN